MVSRRNFLKSSAGLYALASLPLSVRWALAQEAFGTLGLSDPALQPKFAYAVPDAMAPGFKFQISNAGRAKVTMAPAVQQTGLIDPATGALLNTPVFGYGENGSAFTWPGKTFEVQSGVPLEVKWENKLLDPVTGLPAPHPIISDAAGGFANGPVDTSLHWCYSLPGYEAFTIATDGVPVVPHLHGGHTTAIYDGNPEYFFSPGFGVRGPRWVEKKYIYDNDQPAGNLWYHDHALGITRLNVYAGLAGFYFVRDDQDTGKADNPLGLPAWPYEKAYAIQDRMFKDTGELFYPAYPGDPFYDDFITGEGATLDPLLFPNGGPTALAEFFGDHMVVNGVIWPKEDVEPRNYRLHLLNGTDSRFMAIRFREVAPGAMNLANASAPLPFYVIGSDQGLASAATLTDMLVFEPGSRYDVVFDFATVTPGSRIIMENIGGDEPFGGDIPGPVAFGETNLVMAFDVVMPLDLAVTEAFDPSAINFGPTVGPATAANPRKVALFEGMDEFGRLQPLLGTAEPTPAANGQMLDGAIAWHMPTTENPALGSTEVWEIYNATGDAHPVHLHLVNFEIEGRQEYTADVVQQPVVQHNGAVGTGFRLANIALGADVPTPAGYVENAPKDMVTALPGQVTRIRATFDKPGRYVWHCHILSHEDHEMMRVLHVGPGA
jgi:FtsP/CotA-like multicopper oxidase with cupredoxin domain